MPPPVRPDTVPVPPPESVPFDGGVDAPLPDVPELPDAPIDTPMDVPPPDAELMKHVEGLLDPPDRGEEARRGLLSRIAAWAIDHPRQPVSRSPVFADKLGKLRNAVFRERRSLLRDFCQKLVEQTQDGVEKRDDDVVTGIDLLKTRFGYSEPALRDAAARLLRARFN